MHRDDARHVVKDGTDPAQTKVDAKLIARISVGNTFEAVVGLGMGTGRPANRSSGGPRSTPSPRTAKQAFENCAQDAPKADRRAVVDAVPSGSLGVRQPTPTARRFEAEAMAHHALEGGSRCDGLANRRLADTELHFCSQPTTVPFSSVTRSRYRFFPAGWYFQISRCFVFITRDSTSAGLPSESLSCSSVWPCQKLHDMIRSTISGLPYFVSRAARRRFRASLFIQAFTPAMRTTRTTSPIKISMLNACSDSSACYGPAGIGNSDGIPSAYAFSCPDTRGNLGLLPIGSIQSRAAHRPESPPHLQSVWVAVGLPPTNTVSKGLAYALAT